jgi:hypothetical protein
MEQKVIQDIVARWDGIVWRVIELNHINIAQLQTLLLETYDLLDQHSHKSFARKEFISLLVDLNDFSWWLCTLPDTPLHGKYPQVVTIIRKITEHFLGKYIDRQQIEVLIDQL